MATLRFEPFGDTVSLREAMNSLLEDSFVRPFAMGNGQQGVSRNVPLDIYQTENDLVVQAAVPGIRPGDFSISVVNGVLTLKGEHQAQQNGNGTRHYLRQEIGYGSFARSLELPFNVQADKADARFENGVLTITLPKSEEARPREIRVRVQGEIEGEKASK